MLTFFFSVTTARKFWGNDLEVSVCHSTYAVMFLTCARRYQYRIWEESQTALPHDIRGFLSLSQQTPGRFLQLHTTASPHNFIIHYSANQLNFSSMCVLRQG